MAPVPQRLNDGIKLSIIVQLAPLNIIQLLIEKLNGMPFLAKDTSYSDARCVAGDFKHAVEVG